MARCSAPKCPQTYRDTRWGHSGAQEQGWFFQRNGDAWCPRHTPEWVEEWRNKRKKNKR